MLISISIVSLQGRLVLAHFRAGPFYFLYLYRNQRLARTRSRQSNLCIVTTSVSNNIMITFICTPPYNTVPLYRHIKEKISKQTSTLDTQLETTSIVQRNSKDWTDCHGYYNVYWHMVVQQQWPWRRSHLKSTPRRRIQNQIVDTYDIRTERGSTTRRHATSRIGQFS